MPPPCGAALRSRTAAATADEKARIKQPFRGKSLAGANGEPAGEEAATLTRQGAKTGGAHIPVGVDIDEVMHARQPYGFGRADVEHFVAHAQQGGFAAQDGGLGDVGPCRGRHAPDSKQPDGQS